MFTDTVGYTAATQADEARTLDLLRDQPDVVRPLLAAHRGREIKSTGDGFLVEFDSALRALQCAVDIQRRLHDRNSEGGVEAIEIRIGIHLGDVEQRGSDIPGTRSTSPHGSSRSPNPVASASPGPSTTRSGTRSRSVSRSSPRRPSKGSRGWSRSSGWFPRGPLQNRSQHRADALAS